MNPEIFCNLYVFSNQFVYWNIHFFYNSYILRKPYDFLNSSVIVTRIFLKTLTFFETCSILETRTIFFTRRFFKKLTILLKWCKNNTRFLILVWLMLSLSLVLCCVMLRVRFYWRILFKNNVHQFYKKLWLLWTQKQIVRFL